MLVRSLNYFGSLGVSKAPAVSLLVSSRNYNGLARRGRGGRVSVSGTTVTVFGATGKMGKYVVSELGKSGNQLVIPTRPGEMSWRHLRVCGDVGQIYFAEQDFRNVTVAELEEYVKHSEVVINLIGRDYETKNFPFEKVHVEIPEKIAEACANTGVQKLIHLSALNASKDSPSKFFRSKALGEEAVMSKFKNATIVRPAVNYGLQDNNIDNICRMLRLFYLPVCYLDTIRHPVYLGDTANGILACIKDEHAPGNTYEFLGPDGFTIDHLLAYTSRLIHRAPWRFIECSPRVMGGLIALHNKINLWDPWMTLDQHERAQVDELSSGLPGLEDLGVTQEHLKNRALQLYRHHRSADYQDDILREEDTV